jgi:hypothetical protein
MIAGVAQHVEIAFRWHCLSEIRNVVSGLDLSPAFCQYLVNFV